MTVTIIAAVAKNNVIGKDNDLIWDLPDDMKFFTRKTKGKTVIMGRKNYDSIPEKYRPLPNRRNIVITRSEEFQANDCEVVNSIEEALELAKDDEEVFVIGGGQIYKLALDKKLVDKMYLTEIQTAFDGDAFFPNFDKSEWTEIEIGRHEIDSHHAHSFIFKEFLKK
jgi:dihydrofolate reductase